MIEGLDNLVTLESLFLGKNKIEKLQVCETSKNNQTVTMNFPPSIF